jgi:hypothetical protein
MSGVLKFALIRIPLDYAGKNVVNVNGHEHVHVHVNGQGFRQRSSHMKRDGALIQHAEAGLVIVFVAVRTG